MTKICGYAEKQFSNRIKENIYLETFFLPLLHTEKNGYLANKRLITFCCSRSTFFFFFLVSSDAELVSADSLIKKKGESQTSVISFT